MFGVNETLLINMFDNLPKKIRKKCLEQFSGVIIKDLCNRNLLTPEELDIAKIYNRKLFAIQDLSQKVIREITFKTDYNYIRHIKQVTKGDMRLWWENINKKVSSTYSSLHIPTLRFLVKNKLINAEEFDTLLEKFHLCGSGAWNLPKYCDKYGYTMTIHRKSLLAVNSSESVQGYSREELLEILDYIMKKSSEKDYIWFYTIHRIVSNDSIRMNKLCNTFWGIFYYMYLPETFFSSFNGSGRQVHLKEQITQELEKGHITIEKLQEYGVKMFEQSEAMLLQL